MTAPHLPSIPMGTERAEEVDDDDQPWKHWVPTELTDEEMDFHFHDWCAWAETELPW